MCRTGDGAIRSRFCGSRPAKNQRRIASEFLPKLAQRLGPDRTAKGLHPVELRLDERAAALIPGTPAGPKDFDTEFLDYILAVKIVDSVEEAIAHIAAHSSLVRFLSGDPSG